MTKQEWLTDVAGDDKQAARLLRGLNEERFPVVLDAMDRMMEKDAAMPPVTALHLVLKDTSSNKARKSFLFTARAQEMLSDLKEKFGFPSENSMLHHCIAEMHRRTFPAYGSASRLAMETRTPDERRRDSRKGKVEAAGNAALAECRRIASELKGTISVDGGVEYVTWKVYSFGDAFENLAPLDQMTPALIELQYSPDKATCEKFAARNYS